MTHKLAHSLEAAGESVGLGKSSMRKFVDNGDLRSFKVGNRRLISHESLEQFVKLLEQRGFTEMPKGESS